MSGLPLYAMISRDPTFDNGETMVDTRDTCKGKVILVTGAARRVGATIARMLHAEGANVCIHYRGSRDEANELVAQLLRERPDSAVALSADLDTPSARRK